jgi:transcriptional regulator with XRE-family HTH domain
MNIKPKLMAILKERGLTQKQLSEMSGVPQGSISRFDRNDRHVDAHLFAISKALDVRVEDLFEVTD